MTVAPAASADTTAAPAVSAGASASEDGISRFIARFFPLEI
jgi:hypothetical protein